MTGTPAIPDRVSARVGQFLQGKYRLDALLGLGGMAAVYAATHRNGKRFAIKMLHPELSVLPELRMRFLTEGYVANKVNHPGAVAVLDDEVAEDGSVFLVMELLEGETIGGRARRRGGRLGPAEVLALTDQLLDALAAAHDNRIVHRDLKPDNIFVMRSGQVKVLDFGIARLSQGNQDSHTTAQGIAMGTPAFLAPEQARGHWDKVDALTDQWAVGATMFTVLSGRDVHVAGTVNEILLAAMTKPAPPLGSVVPVPAEVAAVVDRALSFEKNRRYPDIRSMQLAMRDAARIFGEGPINLGVTGAGLRVSGDGSSRMGTTGSGLRAFGDGSSRMGTTGSGVRAFEDWPSQPGTTGSGVRAFEDWPSQPGTTGPGVRAFEDWPSQPGTTDPGERVSNDWPTLPGTTGAGARPRSSPDAAVPSGPGLAHTEALRTGLSAVTESPGSPRRSPMSPRALVLGALLAVPIGVLLGSGAWWAIFAGPGASTIVHGAGPSGAASDLAPPAAAESGSSSPAAVDAGVADATPPADPAIATTGGAPPANLPPTAPSRRPTKPSSTQDLLNRRR